MEKTAPPFIAASATRTYARASFQCGVDPSSSSVLPGFATTGQQCPRFFPRTFGMFGGFACLSAGPGWLQRAGSLTRMLCSAGPGIRCLVS
jgi:hypothetical protein